MDQQFYEWAKKKFNEMKSISDPNLTAVSMVKGVMESGESSSTIMSRIDAIIRASKDIK
ncbi:hypothetical protein [Paenibacillus terrae]|uniref:hypothetical protein n=1 Tax=Paenibacillus terrae TaxID=159743 RepID=UPI000B2562F1|nr:hypothetical protein [Paenibacillus terrae]